MNPKRISVIVNLHNTERERELGEDASLWRYIIAEVMLLKVMLAEVGVSCGLCR